MEQERLEILEKLEQGRRGRYDDTEESTTRERLCLDHQDKYHPIFPRRSGGTAPDSDTVESYQEQLKIQRDLLMQQKEELGNFLIITFFIFQLYKNKNL